MRNAGDRLPGGSPGRRQHAADPEPPSPADGGASLFTPAYRVSHGATGGGPTSRDGFGSAAPGDPAGGYRDSGFGDAGYGRSAVDPAAAGYSWADPDPDSGQSGIGYARGGYQDRPGGQATPDDVLGSAYSWASDVEDAWPDPGLPGRGASGGGVSNAVRGFPPVPGEPLPVYPPGPFTAWNRGRPERGDAGRGGQEAGRRGHQDGSQLAMATITPDEFDTDYSLPAIKDPVPGQLARTGAAAARDAARTGQQQRAQAAAGRGHAQQKGRQAGRARKKRQPVWLAIGTAVVIIAAVAAILVVTSPGSGTPVQPAPSDTPTAASSPSAPAGLWGYIGSRKTDTVPLTMNELYPAMILNAGTTYTKAKQAKGTSCRAALIGSALQASVRRGHCTQALRATYLSKSAKVMATIGVFNLKNVAAASKAASKAGRFEFVAQLPAKSGPAKVIGQGTGIEQAVVKGHYLVLVWAETTDLTLPRGPAGQARLKAFMKLLIKHTVNLSLSNRMVDGKPLQRG